MSNFDDLVRAAQTGDRSILDSIILPEGLSESMEIAPVAKKQVMKAVSDLGVDMTDYDFEDLSDLSKEDPIQFKVVFDAIQRAITTIDKHQKPGWKEKFYFSYISTRIIQTDDALDNFMSDIAFRGYRDKATSDSFFKFWNQDYDAFYVIQVQLKLKNVYKDTQPIINFIEAHSMFREKVTSKDFLHICREAA